MLSTDDRLNYRTKATGVLFCFVFETTFLRRWFRLDFRLVGIQRKVPPPGLGTLENADWFACCYVHATSRDGKCPNGPSFVYACIIRHAG